MTISEQIQHSTVRIQTSSSNGDISTGTGFFFKFLEKESGDHVPVIITNKHVVQGAIGGNFRFTISKENKPDYRNIKDYQIANFQQYWIGHPDDNIDLCAMPIGGLINEAQQTGITFFYIPLDKSLIMTDDELNLLTALEDVTMIGYPNGIWDSVNNLPIMRRGITATHPKMDYNGKCEFMIDAACFPGSSGSPVMLLNEGSYRTHDAMVIGSRVKLLGVLYAGPQHTATGSIQIINIPTRQEPIIISRIPNNLGIIIKAKKIIELEAEVKRKLGR